MILSELKTDIAYLQGLAEGLEIDDNSKEGRILVSILDVLADMADAIEDLQTEQKELEDYVETMDEDLSDLEDDFYEEDVECECDDCGDLDLDHIEVECPNCEEIVCFETDLLDDEDLIEITCPNCDAVVYKIGEEE